MKYEQYKQTLLLKDPPNDFSVYLKALWFDGKDDWEKAHNTIQDVEDATASWIHAYLHRKEGDSGNADYWYRGAGRKRPSAGLDEEWETIVRALIDD